VKDKTKKDALADENAIDAIDAVAAPEQVVSANDDEKTLATITQNLPADIVPRIQQLLSSMDPNKPGFEEMGGARFAPPVVKVYQPVSTSAPGNAKLGDIYTDTGDVLEKPWEFIPIYMYYSQAKFEPGNASPACRSEDTKTSVYGDVCNDCPDRPFRDGEKTMCQKSIDVFAFNAGLSKIYHLQFSKTSYKAGSKLFRQAGDCQVPWERTYSLSTEEKHRQGDNAKYFVLTTTSTGKPVDPKYFPLIHYIYQKIKAVRQTVLANVASRDAGKRIMGNLPADLGGKAGETPATTDQQGKPSYKGM